MINKFDDIFDSIYDGSQISLDVLLTALKNAGATQMESVMLLIKNLKMPLREADSLIVNSSVWQGSKEDVFWLRNKFGEYLDGLD
ncbi:hypothetical protein HF324_31955 [Chitinophaga oryzae]|uniref:Uncharacterized protein n=1 Tax=Chitinophaga oryzae TaxID=2725414 RepID=A0ABX6LQ36_9BACT|nr:hypothetical protein [Chitinophaga oryzae]QJB42206.1 hypothetical protein HF324_31955 [Chitinophaga oryzae]